MNGMKFLFASMVAVFGFVLAMIGMDVFAHNQSFHEAFRGMPNQFVHSLGDLLGLAWQYKFPTVVALAIVIAVLYVRIVPEVRNQ
jgi:Co/Zn/Cd efflux system component